MTTLLLSHIFVFTMEKKTKGMGVGPGGWVGYNFTENSLNAYLVVY